MSSIKVAVRVRPLNESEISLKCSIVVEADKSQVTVRNPESERTKTFKFDDVVSSCQFNVCFELSFNAFYDFRLLPLCSEVLTPNYFF